MPMQSEYWTLPPATTSLHINLKPQETAQASVSFLLLLFCGLFGDSHFGKSLESAGEEQLSPSATSK